MIAFAGAPTFGSTLALAVAPAVDTDFVWEGADFDGAAFEEDAPMPFGVLGAFVATAFRPDTFARFPAGPALASFLLFLAAFLLASEPGSKRGP
jgi:hypothetical protein